MKTASVRDLRNQFPLVARWIEEGESVEITRGGKPFARLAPLPLENPPSSKRPDFLARMERYFPDEKPSQGLMPIIEYDRGDR